METQGLHAHLSGMSFETLGRCYAVMEVFLAATCCTMHRHGQGGGVPNASPAGRVLPCGWTRAQFSLPSHVC